MQSAVICLHSSFNSLFIFFFIFWCVHNDKGLASVEHHQGVSIYIFIFCTHKFVFFFSLLPCCSRQNNFLFFHISLVCTNRQKHIWNKWERERQKSNSHFYCRSLFFFFWWNSFLPFSHKYHFHSILYMCVSFIFIAMIIT